MTSEIIARLDARDRAVFARWTVAPPSPRVARIWTLVTHLGSATATILAVLLPAFVSLFLHPESGGRVRQAAFAAGLTLLVSHLLVHLLKRTASRPRPNPADARCRLLDAPDQFSFPSGHSAAVMAVAASYSSVFPLLAPWLVVVALAVGASRVRLGVHYPGDVLAGQAIALLTAVLVATLAAVV